MAVWSGRRWLRIWAAGNGVLAAAFVGADWIARDRGCGNFLAPNRADLWLSVGLGGGLGLITLATLCFMPRPQREFAAAFARLSLRERLRWRYQWQQLLYSGCFILLMDGLIAWCWFNEVFLLPAVSTVNAVLCGLLPQWAIRPSETDQQRQAEQGAAPDPAG